MVKRGKKTAETAEPAVENTDLKTEDESAENNSLENGEASPKKRSKASKKEDTSQESENGEAIEENGEDNDKKKPASKKAKAPKKTAAKVATEPARKSSRTPKPVTKPEEEEGYEVEKLVDHRIHRGKAQYLVRWKGYSKSSDTWEEESGLNCPDLLQKYEENSGSKNKTKKRSASKSPAKGGKKAAEENYEVEEVVSMRMKGGKKEFKIRWKGYKPSEDTWEPEKHLACSDLIKEYLETHKDEVEEAEKNQPKKTPAKKAKSTKSAKGKKSKAK